MKNTDLAQGNLEAQYKKLPLAHKLELALSENLPDDYRPFMLREQWMQTRCYFARRMDLQPQEIAVLATDDDHVIRLCIAKRPDLTAQQVEAFVHDRDPNVRHAIARNALLSPKQREHLLQDDDELVRRAAAKGAKDIKTRQREGQALLIR